MNQICLRCGGKWESRVKHPRYCPLCKSPAWNRARKVGMDGDQDNDVRGAGSSAAVEVKRGGNDATVSVLPKTQGRKKRLHPVQPVRDQLAVGNGLVDEAPIWPCAKHPGKSYVNAGHLGCIGCERK